MSNETKTDTKCRCGNCGWTGPESALRCGLTEIEDFWSRVDPGEVVPAGECPECGGLAVPFDEANARLIAAAPELLAAAGLAVWDWENNGQVNRDAIALLRSAFEKAGGLFPQDGSPPNGSLSMLDQWRGRPIQQSA